MIFFPVPAIRVLSINIKSHFPRTARSQSTWIPPRSILFCCYFPPCNKTRLPLTMTVAEAQMPGSAPAYPPVPTLSSPRSEEHTSELQSHSDLVCRLLLEKKKEK